MLFKAAILLFLTAAGLAQVLASPVEDKIIVLNTEETTKDMLIIDSEAAASPRDASTLAAFITCSTDHTADTNTCRQLINSLRNDGGRTLATSPRDVCLSQSGKKCCVSWSKPAPGLQKSDLVFSATQVLNQCNTGSSVSGLSRGVELHGTTDVTQCLSNRESGCS